MYVAVTVAWYQAYSWEDRRRHPLGPYVLGRLFARYAASVSVDVGVIASVCAQLARRHQTQRGELIPMALQPRQALDPASAWWHELPGTDGLGVHYVELGGGTLEFLSVAYKDERPIVEAGRP